MPTLGWRYLLGISSIPLLLSAISLFWLPESPRYYLSIGKPKMAIEILQKAAKDNKNHFENLQLHESKVT